VTLLTMTTQPHPTVTAADVERIVRRDFPADRAAEVLAMLEEYGTEEWQREPHRVRLAVLKLAAGDLGRLRYEVEGAKRDYRDVLAPAEYPGYTRRMFRISKLAEDEQQRIIDADWKQYDEWLRR
jgi:hypothetical protein